MIFSEDNNSQKAIEEFFVVLSKDIKEICTDENVNISGEQAYQKSTGIKERRDTKYMFKETKNNSKRILQDTFSNESSSKFVRKNSLQLEKLMKERMEEEKSLLNFLDEKERLDSDFFGIKFKKLQKSKKTLNKPINPFESKTEFHEIIDDESILADEKRCNEKYFSMTNKNTGNRLTEKNTKRNSGYKYITLKKKSLLNISEPLPIASSYDDRGKAVMFSTDKNLKTPRHNIDKFDVKSILLPPKQHEKFVWNKPKVEVEITNYINLELKNPSEINFSFYPVFSDDGEDYNCCEPSSEKE